MKLREYQDWKGINDLQMAKLADVSRSYISYIHAGLRIPGRIGAKKISDATGGLVSTDELMYPEWSK